MAERRCQLTAAGLLLLCTLLAACAGTQPRGVPVSGDPRAGQSGAAVPDMQPVSASLLQQSREQQRNGNYGQAAATLERAIRIDSAEPALWLELARVRYTENNWQQAEQLARKAWSLSAAGSPLRDESRQLIAGALRRQGRLQQARDAENGIL